MVESRRAQEWRTAQRERYGERLRKLIRTHLVAILCLLLWPAPVFADVVWPALILEPRLLSWWAIAVGLITEYLFIKSIFGLSPKRAVVVDIAANTVSTLLGIVLIPLAGVVWEFFLEIVFVWQMDSVTRALISWGTTFLLACLVNALLEGLVIKVFFDIPLRIRSWQFCGLLVANMASVGVAFASLWLGPVKL